MKKISTVVAALLLAIGAKAQINLHYLPVNYTNSGWSKTQTVFSDMSLSTNNSESYAEISKALNAGDFYIQLFHEQKFWETPLYMHVEYRGQGAEEFIEHMLMVGVAYSFETKNGFIAVDPLVRFDGARKDWGHVQPMLSVVTGHDWKIFNLNSFTDFWYDKNYMKNGFNWYSEIWSYFNVCKYVDLGAVSTLAWYREDGFFGSIAPAIKIKF